jgi:hypothetical protein
VVDTGASPVTLVSDLDSVVPRSSASRASLLSTADALVAGTIPSVDYNAARAGDPLRYLYDEGVALRRITGILAYAYAATHDARYLRTMAAKVAVNAAGWPDWNPGHALDTAQVATSVALAYRWSSSQMTAAERTQVTTALTTRMVLSYSCADGALAGTRLLTGNQNTVLATGALLASLAVRPDSAWASVGASDAAAALARARVDDGTGRNVAGGPTVEGFMYTTYEAANLALLHATRWLPTSAPVASLLDASLPDLGALASWSERCGSVADPDVEDAWDLYPWVDRPTALAAQAAWPGAGGHVLDLVAALQARDTLAVPEKGTWSVPDGIAELVLSRLTPRSGQPAAVQSWTSGSAAGSASFWGCASNGPTRALLAANPNDAPHGHRDIGNVVVTRGDQTVLADLGQRDYSFSAPYVWRGLTKAHNVVGVLRDDGRVTQTDSGSGTVTAMADGLRMSATNAMSGVTWVRTLTLGTSTVAIRDELETATPFTVPKPMSWSFLLEAPLSQVSRIDEQRVTVRLGDGSVWELRTPGGVTMTLSEAQPTAPYDDTAEFRSTLGPAHTLVGFTAPLSTRLDVTTVLTHVSG